MTTDCGPDPAFAASPSSHDVSRPSGLQSGVVGDIIRDVAELPDDYCKDDPEVMRVSASDLRIILERYETSGESAEQPRVSTLLDNKLFQAAILAHNYLRYAQPLLANNEPGEPSPEDIMEDLVEAIAEARGDSDGTASAALCEDIAVPQDCQARAVRHRQEAVAHRPIRRENNG